jgi:hypothetical protein
MDPEAVKNVLSFVFEQIKRFSSDIADVRGII